MIYRDVIFDNQFWDDDFKINVISLNTILYNLFHIKNRLLKNELNETVT